MTDTVVRSARETAGPGGRLPGPVVEVVVAIGPVLGLEPGPAQRLAGTVGVGRAPVGPPGSDRRRELAAALAASVVRRIARAAGRANRLVVVATPGAAADEVILTWPAEHADLVLPVGKVLGLLGPDLDDGAFLSAIRAAAGR